MGTTSEDFFRVLPGISIAVDDRGCLVISAPHLGGRIVTNDRVELIGSNRFRWLGRWDRVINSGGVKLMPEKIEADLRVGSWLRPD